MLYKTLLAVICALVLVAAFFVPAEAARPNRVTHSIRVAVDCLQEAIAALDTLQGQNLNSHMHFVEEPSRYNRRSATFTRRVDYWAMAHVLTVLRELGEVMDEHGQTDYLGPRLRDSDARISALTLEVDRLSIRMAQSTTLDVLIAIDHRLADVMSQRNFLIGQRNVLLHEASAPVLTIVFQEILAEEEEEEDESAFSSRVADSFIQSLRNIRDAAISFTIFAARRGLAIIIWLAILGSVVLIGWRVFNRLRKKSKPNCVESTQVENETAEEPNAEETESDTVETEADRHEETGL